MLSFIGPVSILVWTLCPDHAQYLRQNMPARRTSWAINGYLLIPPEGVHSSPIPQVLCIPPPPPRLINSRPCGPRLRITVQEEGKFLDLNPPRTRVHDAVTFRTVKPTNKLFERSIYFKGAREWNNLDINDLGRMYLPV